MALISHTLDTLKKPLNHPQWDDWDEANDLSPAERELLDRD